MDRSEWMAEVCRAAALTMEAHGLGNRTEQLRNVADQLAAAPPPPAEQASGESWPDGVLNREKTLEVLTHHNAWRRGASTEQTDPRMLGLALEAAIAFIAPQQPAGEGE